jgi:hypothetical protein
MKQTNRLFCGAGAICIAVLIMTLFILLQGCAFSTQSPDTKAFSDFTPKQKLAWAMGTYNSAYDDYVIQSSYDDLTDAERSVLREKKKILTDLFTTIKIYDTIASDDVPDEELETTILTLVSKLERLVIRNIE